VSNRTEHLLPKDDGRRYIDPRSAHAGVTSPPLRRQCTAIRSPFQIGDPRSRPPTGPARPRGRPTLFRGGPCGRTPSRKKAHLRGPVLFQLFFAPFPSVKHDQPAAVPRSEVKGQSQPIGRFVRRIDVYENILQCHAITRTLACPYPRGRDFERAGDRKQPLFSCAERRNPEEWRSSGGPGVAQRDLRATVG
jgi:hypothetical protein